MKEKYRVALVGRTGKGNFGHALDNIFIVEVLIEAIEKDRAPLDSLADGRAALEMVLAVYESHRLEKLVELPLKNRKHPLAQM